MVMTESNIWKSFEQELSNWIHAMILYGDSLHPTGQNCHVLLHSYISACWSHGSSSALRKNKACISYKTSAYVVCIYPYLYISLCLHFKSFTSLTHKVKQYDEGPHKFYKRRWLWEEQPEAPWPKEKLATWAQPLKNIRESEGDWPSKQPTQSTDSSGWILQSSISGKVLESWQKEWSV